MAVRFCAKGIGALADAPGSGRSPRYTPTEAARVNRWARELPAAHGLPLLRWSVSELARQLLADGIGVLGVDGATLAHPGRTHALVTPDVDLHARSRLRGQSHPRARPVCPHL
ncbi:helix-turn-helix domain-containing protein [Rhodococcus pseudokoreensis]|uniref:helix-turn-helix domain-containing protein n=1 Tax=Rhodococcus pseudokoreensis TaxID=2811421 RepID=UPI0030844F11